MAFVFSVAKMSVIPSTEPKPILEVVNLRIPKGIENIPPIYCLRQKTKKKKTTKKKINLITVPDSQSIQNIQEEFLCIPIIKPWTVEELDELKRRCTKIEERKKLPGGEKKKLTECPWKVVLSKKNGTWQERAHLFCSVILNLRPTNLLSAARNILTRKVFVKLWLSRVLKP